MSAVAIDNTFGAALIGVILSAVLYGITCLQTYFYYMTYPNDSSDSKILVAVIWILDSLHMALISMTIHHYLVSNYNNPSALGVGHWSLFVSVVVNIVIASTVQGFFTLRIFQLCSKKVRWWVASSIALLIVAHMGTGFETVAWFFIKKEFKRLSEITLYAALPFAVFAVLSDIAIAVALCILLHSSRTSFSRTNAVISTLMIYAINRCLLTSVVAIVEIIVFSAAPKSLWFIAIDFCIGRLWTNSMLAALNSRNFLSETADGGRSANTASTGASNLEFYDQSMSSPGQSVQLRSDPSKKAGRASGKARIVEFPEGSRDIESHDRGEAGK